MNLQERSDRRSLALHRQVVKCLLRDPSLWSKPFANIDRWERQGGPTNPYQVWREILRTMPREKILKLLVSRSQRAIHLRSSSPFVGIISQETRDRIFKWYSHDSKWGKKYLVRQTQL